MLSSKEADVSIGAMRVLDKITVISNLLKKKKENCTIVLSNLILLRTSVPSTLILDGWKTLFFLKEIKLRIKEISIRKKIHIVMIVFHC